jgi:hypothetical protein
MGVAQVLYGGDGKHVPATHTDRHAEESWSRCFLPHRVCVVLFEPHSLGGQRIDVRRCAPEGRGGVGIVAHIVDARVICSSCITSVMLS